MFLLSLTATCQVWTVALKAGLYTYKGFAADIVLPIWPSYLSRQERPYPSILVTCDASLVSNTTKAISMHKRLGCGSSVPPRGGEGHRPGEAPGLGRTAWQLGGWRARAPGAHTTH